MRLCNMMPQQVIIQRYFVSAMSKLFYKVFGFVNESILRNTKENTVLNGGVINIMWANITHNMRKMLGFDLKLQYPNNTLKFPLPNRWSNPDISYSKQQSYMIVKQVALNIKAAGMKKREEINQQVDRSRSSISVMNFFNTISTGEIDNVNRVVQKYNLMTDAVYSPERELIFADSMVNGEISYMLRKYAVDYYQLPNSKMIDTSYQTAFEKALENEAWNDNAQKFGLSKEEIIRRVAERDGVYTMLFEHLEEVSGGDTIENFPEIYCDNTKIEEIHYLNVPYPIFLRIKKQDSYSFVCIGIGFRVNKQVKIFSPFFASQGEKVWRLAQSHLAQMAINDFSVRVHLGVYHFTTNQYHVPIYRFLSGLKDNKDKLNFGHFLDHTYGLFSRGLEGVNVAATASLVHPVQKFSLVNKALNIKQDHALQIIAKTSNNIKIFDYNPVSIMRNQGISEEQIKQCFEKMALDFELYDILSQYVKDVYVAFSVGDMTERLMAEINEQTKFMGVGEGSQPRPSLRNKEDVLKTIQNLCFCWVGFHSHTFSVTSLATYALMRPSMLRIPIPGNQSERDSVEIGAQLPDTKVLMETGKLNEATTQRDPDNFLIDNIKRQGEMADYLKNKYSNDKDWQLQEAFIQLKETADRALQRLQKYEDRVLQKNKERKVRGESFTFEWMVPSKIQSSLNI